MSWQIAIDGPASAGKSTVAQAIAEKLNLEYIDSGAMYRAVTLKAIELGINMEEEKEYEFLETTKIDFQNRKIYLDGKDVSKEIRTLEISNNVSVPSRIGYVREKLVAIQRHLAESKNVIMDGRDIGTVVLPNANVKIFLTASVEERARRRMVERQVKGMEEQSLESTVEEIKARDFKDSTRKISPLKKADDAIEIDSSNLCFEEVVEEIIRIVCERGYEMEEKKDVLVEEASTETKEEEVKVELENKETAEVTEEAVEVTEESAPVEETESVEEENKEKKDDDKGTSKYKELQLVEGTVVEVIDAKPAQKGRDGKELKAKEERVLFELEDGQEGFLFRRDAYGIPEEDELFDHFVEGDKYPLVIKKIYENGGKFVFSTALVEMRKNIAKFDEVIKNHGIIKAKVVRVIKVGLLLKHEEFSCLLPTSQISVPEDALQGLVGEELDVAPIRIDYSRIRLIVSHTVAAAIKKNEEKQEFLGTVKVGDVYDGVVKNIEEYGAFVEISKGIEGLLHISEVDHNRVQKIEKILKTGDTVKVKVIKVDNNHIGLSRKALIPNYWQEYVLANQVDAVVKGKVVEINNAGVVVALSENVNGFLPKSEFAWERDAFIEDYYKVEDEIEAKIIEEDSSKKRIILSRKQLNENPWLSLTIQVGDQVEVKVVKELKDGYRVACGEVTGYLSKRGKEYAIGETISVVIRALEPEKTKLIFGIKEERFEREPRPERNDRNPRGDRNGRYGHEGSEKDYAKYMKSEKASNTLGDFFAEQMKKKRK